MDKRELIFLFGATMHQNQRHQAEEQLAMMQKCVHFVPSVLQVVMQNDVDVAVRQAASIFLKREIECGWQKKATDCQNSPQAQGVMTITEADQALIREVIVDAIVMAPDLVRVQLSQCVSVIAKHDFPAKWPQVIDQINYFLQSSIASGWSGALLCLHQIVKNYEYKKPDERGPLKEAMVHLLPVLYRLCVQLLPDPSEQSVLLQKQILKTYFALTQYHLPMDLITKEIFSQWMEIFRGIAERSVPDETLVIEEGRRGELPWWKCKKWALHIAYRLFKRYGSPYSASKEYKEFSEWYLRTFTSGMIKVLLQILEQYRRKFYVAPRVLQQTLNYINQGVSQAFSWKFLKPHILTIIQDVLFPLMSYTDADEELWRTNPHEYIRIKFDIFEDFVSPITAGQSLLHSAASKRKDILQKAMTFLMQVLTWPNVDPKQKDGALHMIGTLADVLQKKKIYHDQMEKILCLHVFPEFSNHRGHMRARASWLLHKFSEVKFKEPVLAEAVQLAISAVLSDREIPVKVEAGIAIHKLLSNQPRVQKYIEPQIKAFTLELLNIIRETSNDDLTNVMQEVVCIYMEKLMPISVEICQNLASTFTKVIHSELHCDERPIKGMGLLNAIETVLTVMDDNQEIMAQLQPIVLQVITEVLQRKVSEFYEEAMTLIYDLTAKAISSELWQILELLYKVFQNDGFDYFVDMMPSLHNYVTVDTEAFLSCGNHILIMFEMCKAIFSGDSDEDTECHAAKLLEVIILQCEGRIDHCIQPFLELVLRRLMRELISTELRTKCLQVVIAALYYNFQLGFEILENFQPEDSSKESMTNRFVKQWIIGADNFFGLHNRKLCVTGLCQLISMDLKRPTVLIELSERIIPALIGLFGGLKKAYALKAQREEDSDLGSDIDPGPCPLSDPEDVHCKGDSFRSCLNPTALSRLVDQARRKIEVLSSDEDETDENGSEFIDGVTSKILEESQGHSNLEEDFNNNDEDCGSSLHDYVTQLDYDVDEYLVFKEVMLSLQKQDLEWYKLLTGHLTLEQQRAVQDIFILADQRKAAAESKQIELNGGYLFQTQTVPATFSFGGSPLER